MRVVEIELNGLYYLLDQEFSSIQIGVSADQGANIYYIDYGKFIVGPENEQIIETNTTKITCYDEMLKAMKPFTITHQYTASTTNRNFLYLIAEELGITLGSSIPSDGVMALHRNHETYTIQNTYRDVLDDFAEILGCCLTIKNGVLECKTGGSNVFVITEEQLKKINFKEPFNIITSLTLSRMPQEDNVSYPDNPSEGEAVKIENNLLVEGDADENGVVDRTPYLSPIYTTLHSIGMFYPIELESFGYCIYEPMDRLEIQVTDSGGNLIRLPIKWMNNVIKVGPGLEEDMECERPEFGETDYTKSSSSAIAEKNTYLYVDKVNNEIRAYVTTQTGSLSTIYDGQLNEIRQQVAGVIEVNGTQQQAISTVKNNVDEWGNTLELLDQRIDDVENRKVYVVRKKLRTEGGVDIYGLVIGDTADTILTAISNKDLEFIDGSLEYGTVRAWIGVEGLGTPTLTVGDKQATQNKQWRHEIIGSSSDGGLFYAIHRHKPES